jgi:transcriptional regulator with XRE-family HTH domain
MIDARKLIRARRLAAGISQRELARRAGTSSATVHRYEAGQVDPSVGTLNRLLRSCLPRRRRWSSVAELGDALDDALARGETNCWRLVAEFLDDDQRADDGEFALSVMDAPGPARDPRARALSAALADHLSARRGLPPPGWTCGIGEVTPWWFVAGDPFKAIALRESPPSFATRGIFITSGALERT